MTEAGSPFSIRPFRDHADRRACVALQEEVWGNGFSERVPAAILMIAGRLGGVASGAFSEQDELIGFVFGLTGLENGGLAHWSDMLAVRAEWRGRGVGKALKVHQRERLLELGVGRAYWTFDPLEARNAFLNLGRLGAVAREYVEDMYGQATSPLHRGIGTDRLVAVWEISSPRVEGRVTGSDRPPDRSELEEAPAALEVAEEDGRLVPGRIRDDIVASRLLVPIPADVQALKAEAPEVAVRWRHAVRNVLRERLEAGWEAREVVREGNLARYVLVRGGEGGTLSHAEQQEELER